MESGNHARLRHAMRQHFIPLQHFAPRGPWPTGVRPRGGRRTARGAARQWQQRARPRRSSTAGCEHPVPRYRRRRRELTRRVTGSFSRRVLSCRHGGDSALAGSFTDTDALDTQRATIGWGDGTPPVVRSLPPRRSMRCTPTPVQARARRRCRSMTTPARRASRRFRYR